MQVFDAPTHLIVEGGGFFVNLFLAPAGGTGVIVMEIASMGPSVVRVGVETGFPGFVFCFSTALGVRGDFSQGIS